MVWPAKRRQARMAYLTFQKQGGGRYTSIFATVARWGDLKGGRRGAVQERLYVGRLDRRTGRVRLSKGMAGGSGLEIEVEELRRRVKESGAIEAVQAWLGGLCPGMAGVRAGGAFAGLRGDLGTALVGQVYALGEMAKAMGLDRCLAGAFGEQVGLALLHLAMHQAVRGEPLYLAAA